VAQQARKMADKVSKEEEVEAAILVLASKNSPLTHKPSSLRIEISLADCPSLAWR